MFRLFSPWILFLVLLLAACNRPAVPAASSRDSVLAQVNGKRITVDQFNQKWSQLSETVRTAYTGPSGRKEFLEELITRELLLQKAYSLKLDQDPAFRERVKDVWDRMLLDATLHQWIEKKIVVSDEEVAAYFDAHRDAFPPIEEARAAHILVKTEAEARTLLGKLRHGADFAALAKTNSTDPGTRDRGGDLGRVRRGQTPPEFEKAVFGLKPGRISGVVKTPVGYHIIRVQSRPIRKPLTVEDARNEIRQRIIKEKEAALFEERAKTLRAESRIVISDSLLGSIGDDATKNNAPILPVGR
ncbi:MAG: peptidylprolyl isomerase [Nitrospirae bacterium]|nr:peptidylprolyl isomerase [Nitrospirota bacterium]